MTVLTRMGRAFFARRHMPGRTRVWLRLNSKAWAHFDQSPTAFNWCSSCGGRYDHKPDHTGAVGDHTATAIEKHRIGTAWIDGVSHAKWCDGTETPE